MPELEHALRFIATVFALLLSVSNAVAAELADLRAARSLVAEAALVLRLGAEQRLTAVYVSQTESVVRRQLQSELKSLAPKSREAELVEAALTAIQADDPRRLEEIQKQLTGLVDIRE